MTDELDDANEAIGLGTGIDLSVERQFATHREKFALKRRRDLQKKILKAQYGKDEVNE